MTMLVTDDKLRWWQYVGPWPMYPVPVFFLLSAISMAAQLHRLTAEAFVFFVLDSIVFGFVCASVLWSSRRWLPNFSQGYVGYFATILVTANLAVLSRVFQGVLIDYEGVSVVNEFGVFAIRVFILICLIQTVFGVFERRLRQQVSATQRALAMVEQQSEALLQADEEIRGSVAALLHDRVQGGLLAACLRLRRSAEVSNTQSATDVAQVISELEQLRAIDVRRAVRALSPNLSELDLEAVLNELADAYRPAVDISVLLNLDFQPEPQLALGVYRISEQALMNSVSHGNADSVQINVSSDAESVTVSITDDGVGMDLPATTGFGSTLIDTWCRTLSGSWDRYVADGRTVLTAELPLGKVPAAPSNFLD